MSSSQHLCSLACSVPAARRSRMCTTDPCVNWQVLYSWGITRSRVRSIFCRTEKQWSFQSLFYLLINFRSDLKAKSSYIGLCREPLKVESRDELGKYSEHSKRHFFRPVTESTISIHLFKIVFLAPFCTKISKGDTVWIFKWAWRSFWWDLLCWVNISVSLN